MMTSQVTGMNPFLYSPSSSYVHLSENYQEKSNSLRCKVKTLKCPVCDIVMGGKSYNFKRHLKHQHNAACCMCCMQVMSFEELKHHICKGK